MNFSPAPSNGTQAPLMIRSLPQAIIHVDCDAFFASVEQALHPELKGKPVITGKERGIASAISYEARAFGVARGMPLYQIKKMCPGVVILPSDYETYSLYSQRFYGILRRFTPDVEEYSIDEAFADLTGLRRVYRTSYEGIAFEIKNTIERELGITVSVGMSLTKSLAKIASKQNKPSGFTCVRGYELHHFLKEIPTERVCGFGPASVALLAKHGVKTVWDFVCRPEPWAKKILGKIGAELWHELRGERVYALSTGEKKNQASLGKTKTFTPASNDADFVRAQLLRNVESAFIKLRRHKLRAATLSIHLTTQDFRSRGLSAELSRATDSTLEATPLISALFERIFDPQTQYRQTGIVLSGIEPRQETQYDLFEDICRVKALNRLSETMDEINACYGKHAVHLASTDCLRGFSQHLGDRGDVAARKVHLLRGETFRQRLAIPVWGVRV